MVQINLFAGQEKRHISREWICGPRGEGVEVGGGGMNWETD